MGLMEDLYKGKVRGGQRVRERLVGPSLSSSTPLCDLENLAPVTGPIRKGMPWVAAALLALNLSGRRCLYV